MTRVMPMNPRNTGSPMIRGARPSDSDRPVTAKVKYTQPVTRLRTMKNSDTYARGSAYTEKKWLRAFGDRTPLTTGGCSAALTFASVSQ